MHFISLWESDIIYFKIINLSIRVNIVLIIIKRLFNRLIGFKSCDEVKLIKLKKKT